MKELIFDTTFGCRHLQVTPRCAFSLFVCLRLSLSERSWNWTGGQKEPCGCHRLWTDPQDPGDHTHQGQENGQVGNSSSWWQESPFMWDRTGASNVQCWQILMFMLRGELLEISSMLKTTSLSSGHQRHESDCQSHPEEWLPEPPRRWADRHDGGPPIGVQLQTGSGSHQRGLRGRQHVHSGRWGHGPVGRDVMEDFI